MKLRITKGGSNIFLSNKSQWTIASNNMNITFVLMVQGIARDRWYDIIFLNNIQNDKKSQLLIINRRFILRITIVHVQSNDLAILYFGGNAFWIFNQKRYKKFYCQCHCFLNLLYCRLFNFYGTQFFLRASKKVLLFCCYCLDI